MLVTVGSGWTYYRANRLVLTGQTRSMEMLIKGIALAVNNEMVIRDYAEIESRLRLTMARGDVRSALVTDRQGKVLVYLRRVPGHADPMLIFDTNKLLPPLGTDRAFQEVALGDGETIWGRIDFGVPLGWVRLEVTMGEVETALAELRQEVLVLTLLGVVGGLGLIGGILRRTHLRVRWRESKMLATQQSLERIAYHDSLTHLPNRHLLLDRLAQAISRSDRQQNLLAVCFMDLDRFKQVNDQYGHEAGDAVLMECARRVTDSIRLSDTLSRLGGDEFVLLLEGSLTVEECDLVLHRVLEAVRRPITINAHEIVMGASIGVTYYPFDEAGPAELLDHADQAMYEAKRSGRNRCCLFAPRQNYIDSPGNAAFATDVDSMTA